MYQQGSLFLYYFITNFQGNSKQEFCFQSKSKEKPILSALKPNSSPFPNLLRNHPKPHPPPAHPHSTCCFSPSTRCLKTCLVRGKTPSKEHAGDRSQLLSYTVQQLEGVEEPHIIPQLGSVDKGTCNSKTSSRPPTSPSGPDEGNDDGSSCHAPPFVLSCGQFPSQTAT